MFFCCEISSALIVIPIIKSASTRPRSCARAQMTNAAAYASCAMFERVPERDIKKDDGDSKNDKCQSTNELSGIYVNQEV